LSYWKATPLFGIQNRTHNKGLYQMPDLGTKDDYQFFLDAGPLSNLDKYYGKDNEFWQQLKDHSSYDDFGKESILQHLKTLNQR
jgi:hypothetical protein